MNSRILNLSTAKEERGHHESQYIMLNLSLSEVTSSIVCELFSDK